MRRRPSVFEDFLKDIPFGVEAVQLVQGMLGTLEVGAIDLDGILIAPDEVMDSFPSLLLDSFLEEIAVLELLESHLGRGAKILDLSDLPIQLGI